MAEVVDKPYVDFLHISVDYICIGFKIRLDMFGFVRTTCG